MQAWNDAERRWRTGGRINRLAKAVYARPMVWLGPLGLVPRLLTLECQGDGLVESSATP